MPTASTHSAPSSVGTFQTNGIRPMPSAIAKIASGISRALADELHDLADEHALHDREDHADEGEHESDRRRGEAEASLR